MRYLLDTNWAIDAIRGGRRAVPVFERIEQIGSENVGLSVVSLAELSVGHYRSRDEAQSRADTLRFVAAFRLLPVDEETCEIFGRIKAQLQRAGNTIEDFDTMIAATAIQHGLTLLSNNRKHFDRVDGLTLDPA